MIGFYGKFICPNCGKKFRQKIHVKKGAKPEDCQRVLWDGSIFYTTYIVLDVRNIFYIERIK